MRTPHRKKPSPIEHIAMILAERWRDPGDDLVNASRVAAVWIRMRGCHEPVKYQTPVTTEDINRLRIEKWAPVAHSDVLSKRELQIFLALAVGKSVSEIAREVCLSVKTVSTYRGRIIEKTGLKNNAEFAVYALSAGLVTWKNRTLAA